LNLVSAHKSSYLFYDNSPLSSVARRISRITPLAAAAAADAEAAAAAHRWNTFNQFPAAM
jgi:hypothetical protein